jgi:purine-nucleoside phosphorylase
MYNNGKVHPAAEAVRKRLQTAKIPGNGPEIGIVLGTGLGSLAEALEDALYIPYAEIPGYPVSTVHSHAGRFCLGRYRGRSLVLQDGRCHLYEGYAPADVVMGVRVMHSLGVESLVVTNAAGSLNPLFPAGSLMLLSDQINLTGQSPLVGLPDEPGRTRFPDMSRVFDSRLRELAMRKALQLKLRLETGVYLGLAGPQLETRAETRMFRAWGADAVGMSTVLEVIAARHLGLRVLGLAALSNQNLPDDMAETSLEEIVAVAGQAAQKLRLLLDEIIPDI